jgi:hypothetical protein
MKRTGNLAILCFLLLAACSPIGASVEPTDLPPSTPIITASTGKTPTSDPTYTPTSTTQPTLEPTQTLMPTVKPTRIMREETILSEGGYSFRAPIAFNNEAIEGMAYLTSISDPSIIIVIVGFKGRQVVASPEEIADDLIDDLSSLWEENLTRGEPLPTEVDGVIGSLFQITGDRMNGEFILVQPDDFSLFLTVGVWGNAYMRSENRGREALQSVLESVTFLDSTSSSTCRESIDTDYGYSKDNPIRVGGGAFEGPRRERLYLDNLLGPNGEEISYERLGSMEHNDAILDEYRLSYPGMASSIVLYLDEYRFSAPLAPFGLTCNGPFDLPVP